jgi:hypothetical protein
MMDPEDGYFITKYLASGRSCHESKLVADHLAELVLFCQRCGDEESFEKVAATLLVVGTRSIDEALNKTDKLRALLVKMDNDLDKYRQNKIVP